MPGDEEAVAVQHPSALVCFDGSTNAEAAARTAVRLLPPMHAYVLTVWHPPAPSRELLRQHWHPGMSIDDLIATLHDLDERDAEKIASDGAAIVRGLGWTAEASTERTFSGFWFEIIRVGDQRNVAVIVLGARGLSALKSRLGSVSAAVVLLASRPVLVVPTRRRARIPQDGPLLLADDGSPASRAAIARAGRLMPGATAIVAHVGDADGDGIADEGTKHALAAGLMARACTVDSSRRPWQRPAGAPWRALVRLARTEHAAAIVVGAQGRSAAARVLLGSVTTGLLHNSDRPVLVVPTERPETARAQ